MGLCTRTRVTERAYSGVVTCLGRPSPPIAVTTITLEARVRKLIPNLLAAMLCTVALSSQGALLSQPAGTKSTPECGSACTWSIAVDGTEVAGGWYAADPTSGTLSGGSQRFDLGDGSYVQMNNMFGNIDPILGFAASAGTGALGKSFAFSFTLPIALSGSLVANASVSYSLTSLTNAGAQITPLFGKVVVAQEVDSTPLGLVPLNKGVDVGDTFGFLGGPQTQNSPVYAANSTLTGNLAYDLMSVTVVFALSANSQVGLSGFVQQDIAPGGDVGTVPLPAAAWLLASGLAGLSVIRRRRA